MGSSKNDPGHGADGQRFEMTRDQNEQNYNLRQPGFKDLASQRMDQKYQGIKNFEGSHTYYSSINRFTFDNADPAGRPAQ